MPQLFIYEARNPQARYLAWPVQSIPEGFVSENRNYILELKGAENPDTAGLSIDGEPLLALRNPSADTSRWQWHTDFYAGSVLLTLDVGTGRRHESWITTDPDLAKITRANFDTMIGEILEDTYALFSLSSFRSGVARGTGAERPALARLEFLRSRIDELEKVVMAIQASPLRILKSSVEKMPFWQARAIKGIDLRRSYAGSLGRLPFQLSLGDRRTDLFPCQLQVHRKTSGYDVYENRVIKSSLEGWRCWLRTVADRLKNSQEDDEKVTRAMRTWGKICSMLARRVTRLLELPLFADVSVASPRIAVTSAFRRLPAYRRFLRLHRELTLGIARIHGDFLQMPLSRTFELYELWAFLRIIRSAIQQYNLTNIDPSELFSREDAQQGLAVLRGVTVIKIAERISVGFKREFREYWTESNLCGSFSRKMIPDITVSRRDVGDVEQLVILDAKYRVDTQLNDALASLHMYRDAILQETTSGPLRKAVVAAYMLTPSILEANLPWKDASMPARLFHPEYRSAFKFGAVTLIPGMSLTEIGKVLDLVLRDAGINVSS